MHADIYIIALANVISFNGSLHEFLGCKSILHRVIQNELEETNSEYSGMTFYKVWEAFKNILRVELLKCCMLPFR